MNPRLLSAEEQATVERVMHGGPIPDASSVLGETRNLRGRVADLVRRLGDAEGTSRRHICARHMSTPTVTVPPLDCCVLCTDEARRLAEEGRDHGYMCGGYNIAIYIEQYRKEHPLPWEDK